MLNLKKITTTVSLLSLGALSVALFSTGCDSGTSSNGTGGAGGKSSTGGAGGNAGGHAGSAAGRAAGGPGGSATGGAAAGHGGNASGGTAGAAGGSAGSAGGAGVEANIMYNVTLTGAMEVFSTPTAASTATGAATVTLNPNTGAVSVQGSFTGLSAAASSAHIHGPAAAGVNADIILPLTATPATAGAVSGLGT